ncbi:MAG: hypothetical protein V1661_02770 [bacterium]
MAEKKSTSIEYVIVESGLAKINDFGDLIDISPLEIPLKAKNKKEAKKMFAKYLESRSKQLEQQRYAVADESMKPRLEKRIIIKKIIN